MDKENEQQYIYLGPTLENKKLVENTVYIGLPKEVIEEYDHIPLLQEFFIKLDYAVDVNKKLKDKNSRWSINKTRLAEELKQVKEGGL